MTTNIYKPILFNTEMVQAILAGRKTQTRRIVKPQPSYLPYTDSKEGHEKTLKNYIDEGLKNGAIKGKYQIGDILWVREKTIQNNVSGIYLYGDEGELTAAFSPFLYKKRPSIHMPKEAARIFLKITNVRCERLQDISEDDAIAEGVLRGDPEKAICFKHYGKEKTYLLDAKNSFQTLWESINAKKHPWSLNPWVWVYDFERIEKPENFLS